MGFVELLKSQYTYSFFLRHVFVFVFFIYIYFEYAVKQIFANETTRLLIKTKQTTSNNYDSVVICIFIFTKQNVGFFLFVDNNH